MERAVAQSNAAGGINENICSCSCGMTTPIRATGCALPRNWVTREKADVLTGSFLSKIGLAVTAFVGHKKLFFWVAEPLTDKIAWQDGNRYTFCHRALTGRHVAMLVSEADAT